MSNSFNLTVITPSRTLTLEALTDIYVAAGYENLPKGNDLFDDVYHHSPGLSSFDLDDVWDVEKVNEAIKKHDIAASVESSGHADDAPPFHTLYTPSSSPIDPDTFRNVNLNHNMNDYVTVSDLNELLSRYGKDPDKMTKNQCIDLINGLNALIEDNSKDPHDILKKYSFETELGRDVNKTIEIDVVLDKLDNGLITTKDALEQIKQIKEK